jgi:transposase
MKVVDLYARVRRACHAEGMSQREAARVFSIDPKTVAKMLRFAVPPGYRRSKPPVRPKLDPLLPVIDRILKEDQSRPRKQRHTARRLFERLKAEHGFTGGETIVKDYVRERRLRGQEMFVPLVHPPGHGQADFGEAVAVIGGVEQRIHFLAVDLPQSDACFVRAYLAETTEAFCDGHNAAFAFFGRVPQSMLYDNTKLAVARILVMARGSEPGASRNCSPTTCLPIALVARARATTKARSRDWSAMPGATSWCRCRRSRASRP